MVALISLCLLLAIATPLLTRAVRATQVRHARAGRFGDLAREQAVAPDAIALVAQAEAWLRLNEFAEVMRTHAWKGTLLQVRRERSGWFEWSAPGGPTWHVRAGGRPGHVRRIVVSAAQPTDDGVVVRAYGSFGGYPPVAFSVQDVRARDAVS